MRQQVKNIRKLIENIGLAVLLNLLVKPGWLLMENQVQNQLGHAAFGTFTALFALAYVGGVLVDPGLHTFTTKSLAASGERDYSPSLFPLKAILTLCFPFLIGLAGWLLGYRGQALAYLLVIATGYGLTQFVLFLRSLLQGGQLFNLDSWAAVAEKLVLLLLVGALLGTGLTLASFVYLRTLAPLVVVLGLLGLIRWQYGRLRWQFTWPGIREVLRRSYPFALIMLVYGLNERVDMVMVERLASSQEAGLYAAAYRWVDVFMMYLWTVLPLFFARFARPEAEEPVRPLLRLGQVVVSLPLVFVAVFFFFHEQLLFWQYRHSSSADLARMGLNLKVLFLNLLVHGIFAIYSTVLTARGQEKVVAGLVALSIGLNIGLNAWLIPIYGSLAAAANTLACAVFVSLGYLLLVQRRLQIAPPLNLLARLGVVLAVLVAVVKGLTLLGLPWYGQLLIAGVAYAFSVILLRVVPLPELFRIFVKKDQP